MNIKVRIPQTFRIAVGAVLPVMAAVLGMAAQAATIHVVPDGATGCKIRSAIHAANTDSASGDCAAGSGSDTLLLVQYDQRPYYRFSGDVDDDTNQSGDLDITSTIIIQGENPTQSVLVGEQLQRAIDVHSGGNLTLNDVAVIGGSPPGSGSGGGVARKNSGALLTINRSVLRGGSGYYGGALYAVGSGTLRLDRTSVLDNTASWGGGGIFLSLNSGVEAELINVTLSGNRADIYGGGIYVSSSSGLRLRNVTVARNRAFNAGGVYFAGSVNSTAVNLANSVLVENINDTGLASDLRCNNTNLGARAYTMIGTIEGCSFASFSGIPTSSDARLSPLFDAGAGVPTHALLTGSAAIDAGNPSSANALVACRATDARGVARSTGCDLGAFERRFDITVDSFDDFPDLSPTRIWTPIFLEAAIQ